MATLKKTVKKTTKNNAIVRREYSRLNNILADNEQKSFNIVADMGDEGSGVWDTELKAYLDARNLKNLFFSESWPYTIIDLIAMKISNQRLVIYKDEALPNGKLEAKVVENHPYQKTINRPNPHQDYHAWMYCVVVDLINIGNGIVWKGLTGYSLWQIPSDEITLDFDKEGRAIKYRRLASNDFGTPTTVAEFNPENIIHIKRPNPNSLFWGLSPFVPGRKSCLFDRYSMEYLNNYYCKGTTPGLTLEMGDAANEKNAVRMLKSFELAYQGRRNQRRTMILPKGVTAKNTSVTLADQQLKDYLDRNRENILSLLKVPKHEVGLQTTGSLGSEEYKMALTNFWSTTLKPTQRMIAGALTDGLKEHLGEGFYFGFDNSDVEVLRDDLIKKNTIAQGLKDTHTLNEIRQEIYDKPPVEGGDEVIGSRPQMPFGLSLPGSIVETKTVSTPDVVFETPEETSADRMIKAHKGWYDSRVSRIAKETKEPIKKMLELSADMLMEQGKAIIKSLQSQLQEKAVKPISSSKLQKLIDAALKGYQEAWIDNYTKILTTTIDFGYGLTIDAPFKLPATDEIIAIGDRSRGKRNDILEARGMTSFEHMSKTTSDSVMDIVKQGIKDQKTIQQITEQIASKYTDVDNTLYRAERIARTEVLTAASMGQAAAMEDAKEVIPDLQKMWLAADDERVRGRPGGLYEKSNTDHWHLHGQIVDSDDPFTDTKSGEQLMFPRDPSASKGNIINCRCTMVILPKSDMDEFGADASAKPNK